MPTSKDHRTGREFILTTAHSSSLLQIIPMIPRGWLMVRGGKPMFEGMILSTEQMQKRFAKVQHLVASAKARGIVSEIREITGIHNITIRPQYPPAEALVATMEHIPKDDNKQDSVSCQHIIPFVGPSMRALPAANSTGNEDYSIPIEKKEVFRTRIEASKTSQENANAEVYYE